MLLCYTCVSSCVCAPWLGPFRRTPLALHCTEGSSRGACAIPLGGCRLYSPECREGFFSETQIHTPASNLATNPATHRGISFGGILLVVEFSLTRCLPGSHARFRIFIRHHDMLCWVRGVPEVDSARSGIFGVGLCRILDANVGGFTFHDVRE